MNINYSRLKLWTFGYAALPLLIFLSGWLKPFIGLPLSALLIYVLYISVYKGKIEAKMPICENKKLLVGLLIVALSWCYLSGFGGFYYQSLDHHWRNAVFHDLIDFAWPVRYKINDTALVYYIGFWLPSALAAYLSGLFNADMFLVGNIFLLAYGVLGIFLLMLNLLYALQVKNGKQTAIVVLLLIFFSGLDILCSSSQQIFEDNHLEWWAFYFQYSSFTTDLFWVYNQAIIAWLMTLSFYNEQQEKDFAFIAILSLFCAPIPTIGLTVYMIVFAINDFFQAVDDDKLSQYFRNVFSFQNIISVFLLLPIVGLYLTANASVSNNGLRLIFDGDWLLQLLYLPLFWLVEFGIFAILIAPGYKNNLLYKTTIYSLLAFPLLLIGNGKDLCMRGSIPALMILMILTARYLLDNLKNKDLRLRIILLCSALIIGAATPAAEFYRSFKMVAQSGSVFLRADMVKTFNGKIYRLPGTDFPYNGNFGTFEPDHLAFYKYLARSKN